MILALHKKKDKPFSHLLKILSYSVQGFQIIYDTLHYMFLSTTNIDHTTQLACPILADYLVQKVSIPETALLLIAKYFNTNRFDPLVQDTLNESCAYGAAMFPN
jgi:hypothetical protein